MFQNNKNDTELNKDEIILELTKNNLDLYDKLTRAVEALRKIEEDFSNQIAKEALTLIRGK